MNENLRMTGDLDTYVAIARPGWYRVNVVSDKQVCFPYASHASRRPGMGLSFVEKTMVR